MKCTGENYGSETEKRGLERKIDGRKERGNFGREIPSFVLLPVCIPPLLATLSSCGRFFLLHFAHARAYTVVCFYFTLPGLSLYDLPARAWIESGNYEFCAWSLLIKSSKKAGIEVLSRCHLDSVFPDAIYKCNCCLETFSVKIEAKSNFNQFPSNTSIHLTQREIQNSMSIDLAFYVIS